MSLQIRDSNNKAGSEKSKQKVCEAGDLLKRHGQWALQIGLLQIQTSLIYIEKSTSLINASAEALAHVEYLFSTPLKSEHRRLWKPKKAGA